MKKTLSNTGQCAHKNIKFFEKKNRVICLDCGEDWNHETITYYPIYQQPVIAPYVAPFPYYPTWSNPAILACASSNVSFDNLPEGASISNTLLTS